jgi:hypothetical protein
LHRSVPTEAFSVEKSIFLMPSAGRILIARSGDVMIHLESAVFMFHMEATTPEIIGSLRAACSEPFNGFWLAPSANQNRRPKHAGVPDTLARSWRLPPGDCVLLWKETNF